MTTDDEAAEVTPYGFCYGCRAEVPLDMARTGFRLATHAGRDGIKCQGSGSKAGYICSSPDPPKSGP